MRISSLLYSFKIETIILIILTILNSQIILIVLFYTFLLVYRYLAGVLVECKELWKDCVLLACAYELSILTRTSTTSNSAFSGLESNKETTGDHQGKYTQKSSSSGDTSVENTAAGGDQAKTVSKIDEEDPRTKIAPLCFGYVYIVFDKDCWILLLFKYLDR